MALVTIQRAQLPPIALTNVSGVSVGGFDVIAWGSTELLNDPVPLDGVTRIIIDYADSAIDTPDAEPVVEHGAQLDFDAPYHVHLTGWQLAMLIFAIGGSWQRACDIYNTGMAAQMSAILAELRGAQRTRRPDKAQTRTSHDHDHRGVAAATPEATTGACAEERD